MALSAHQINSGFALIERAAIEGKRCPTNRSAENPTGELASGITGALVKAGRIRIEVYAHNWRVVEILKGPFAGKRTAASPYKGSGKPYLVLPAPGPPSLSMTSQHGQSK